MSLVLIKAVEGVLSDEQKGELIRRVTDVVAALDGGRAHPITSVLFGEIAAGEWGIGGERPTRGT